LRPEIQAMQLPSTSTPRWIIILTDLLISFLSLVLAFLIRFDVYTSEDKLYKELNIILYSIPVFFIVKGTVFYLFQIHKGLVRHTSSYDVRRITVAGAVCTFLFFALGLVRYFFIDDYFLFPTSVLITEFLIGTFLMIGARFIVKLYYLESIKRSETKKRVLIYGAGVSGLITKRTIEKDVRIGYDIVGFIDDNKKLKGNRLEGTTIMHSSKLEYLIDSEGVNEVIIAIQSAKKENKKKIIETCLEKGVNVVSVPSHKSWINGEFSAKQIQKVRIEDLLGRKEIQLDEDKISAELKGKVILITGAAGSIGSGMVRILAKYQPAKLVLLDQAESPLYDLQNELKQNFDFFDFDVIIGDIRNTQRIHNVFETYQPDVVFHAAAYKHVPLMEDNPSEAILTNINGTKNLVDAACATKVEKFVMISTDKAVNPTNVMGASKRIAEIYAQIKNEKSNTQFITTRFGNVLGSNGSVIPLFRRQIEQGGPITVTDERITRFFMTIPEACQLVLEAGSMGQGGEIFVFDMGESVKIIDLAKKMIKLSGLELGKDIEIKISGLRPGEKLYEELLANEENTIETHHPQILKALVRAEKEEKLGEINALISLFENQNNFDIVRKMKELVPEFKSNNSEFQTLDK
jgi:FlaA1/EpsC-like NDP-sugar epimerase